MKDDKKLELLLERFYNRFNQYNTKVLEKMGEPIKKFDGVSPSMAHKIAQQLKYGADIDDLIAELSQLSGKSIKDIEELLKSLKKAFRHELEDILQDTKDLRRMEIEYETPVPGLYATVRRASR